MHSSREIDILDLYNKSSVIVCTLVYGDETWLVSSEKRNSPPPPPLHVLDPSDLSPCGFLWKLWWRRPFRAAPKQNVSLQAVRYSDLTAAPLPKLSPPKLLISEPRWWCQMFLILCQHWLECIYVFISPRLVVETAHRQLSSADGWPTCK